MGVRETDSFESPNLINDSSASFTHVCARKYEGSAPQPPSEAFYAHADEKKKKKPACVYKGRTFEVTSEYSETNDVSQKSYPAKQKDNRLGIENDTSLYFRTTSSQP